mmetsp:Transcript_24986/g.63394  ORF Transcript_24986/g.63394 Transcript_24986/m.63394 type:complete len:267 (-) Transcript_24986:380-1180(-)
MALFRCRAAWVDARDPLITEKRRATESPAAWSLQQTVAVWLVSKRVWRSVVASDEDVGSTVTLPFGTREVLRTAPGSALTSLSRRMRQQTREWSESIALKAAAISSRGRSAPVIRGGMGRGSMVRYAFLGRCLRLPRVASRLLSLRTSASSFGDRGGASLPSGGSASASSPPPTCSVLASSIIMDMPRGSSSSSASTSSSLPSLSCLSCSASACFRVSASHCRSCCKSLHRCMSESVAMARVNWTPVAAPPSSSSSISISHRLGIP